MNLYGTGTLVTLVCAGVLLCAGVALNQLPRPRAVAPLLFSGGVACALLFGGLLLYGHLSGQL